MTALLSYFTTTHMEQVMKLNGKRPGAHIEPIVLPRPGEPLVFLAKAIDSFEEFDKICPAPEPPQKIMPGKKVTTNFEDPGYKKDVAKHGQFRLAYMVVKGLLETPNFEWETVKLEDYNTWLSYEEELRQAGFSGVEIGRIVSGVAIANCLNEAAITEARENFLAGRLQGLNESFSLTDVPLTTPSGDAAKDS